MNKSDNLISNQETSPASLAARGRKEGEHTMMAEGIAHGAASKRQMASHAPSVSRFVVDPYQYGKAQKHAAFALVEIMPDDRRFARHHFRTMAALEEFAQAHGIEVDTE